MTRRGLALFALLAVTASSFAVGEHEDWANTDAVAGQVMDSVFQELGRQLLQAPGVEPEAAPAEPAATASPTEAREDKYNAERPRHNDDDEPHRHKKNRRDDFDEKKYFDKIKEYFTDALEYFKEKTSGSRDKIAELAELQRKAVKNARDGLEERLGDTKDKLGESGEKFGERFGGLTDKVRIRLDEGKLGVSEFLENVLGKDYKEHLPDFLKRDSLDWRKLGGKDFDGHLADLAHDIDDFSFEKLVKEVEDGQISLASVQSNFQTVIARYCSTEKYTPPSTTPTGCTGAAVAIQLVPRYCQLDDVQWQLVCEPPKLALQFFPGSCNLKYEAASLWQGKRCRVAGNIGSSRTAILGGRSFNVVLSDLSDADNLAQQFDRLVEPAKHFIKERLEKREHDDDRDDHDHEGRRDDHGEGRRGRRGPERERKDLHEEIKERVQKGEEGVEKKVKEGEERVKKALKHEKPEHEQEEKAAPL